MYVFNEHLSVKSS